MYPPARRLVEQPPGGCCGCSVRHYVQQFPVGDVDDAGRPRLVSIAALTTKQGLVETHRGRCADLVDISIEQRLTPPQHRVVHRRPATRQVRSNIAHRTATAVLACRPTRCSGRQQHPRRRDLVVVFSRRTRAAITTGAAPTVFATPAPPGLRATDEPQSLLGHLHLCLCHASRAGRPKLGRSTSSASRLPSDHNLPPHPAHDGRAVRYRTLNLNGPPRSSSTLNTSTSPTPTNNSHMPIGSHTTPILQSQWMAYDPDSGGSRPTNRQHPTTPTPTSNAKSRFTTPILEDPTQPTADTPTTPTPTSNAKSRFTTPILEDPTQPTANTPQPPLPPQTRRAGFVGSVNSLKLCSRGELDGGEVVPIGH